jgi:hypothetical protein
VGSRCCRLGPVWAVLLLSCGAGVVWAPAGGAQESPFAIRVEAPEVVVPVVVLDRTRRVTSPGVYEELDEEITNLAVRDFHVFEDGVEQPVDDVSMEMPRIRDARDNISHHVEESYTPRGTWSSPDLWAQEDGVRLTPLATYLVSYTPPLTSRGSCHRIQVRVKRRHTTVYSRDEYCNVRHPLTDPIGGTKLGQRMEDFAESGELSGIPVWVQAGALLADDSKQGRVEIAMEFPWSSVKRKWVGVNLYGMVAVMGIVRNQDGTVVGRFSDLASTAPWNVYRGPLPPERAFLAKWELAGIPNRYETQMELPPGAYELQVVVTDGERFGTKTVPVRVNAATSGFGVSDVLLCNRFAQEPEGAEAAARAPKYVPLASHGVLFTLAADVRFTSHDRVVSYFEIYERSGDEAADVRFRMSVVDAKTGDIRVNGGWQTVDGAAVASDRAIPVAAGLLMEELPAGSYLLRVEVTNSSGEIVAVRSHGFSVE